MVDFGKALQSARTADIYMADLQTVLGAKWKRCMYGRRGLSRLYSTGSFITVEVAIVGEFKLELFMIGGAHWNVQTKSFDEAVKQLKAWEKEMGE